MDTKTRVLVGVGASAVAVATWLGPGWPDSPPAGGPPRVECGDPAVAYPSEDSATVDYASCGLSPSELRLVWCEGELGASMPANVVVRVAGKTVAECYR